MRHPKYVQAACRLLGPNSRLHFSKINLKMGGFGAPVQWHQDWAFYPHTNNDVLVSAVLLDDMVEDNGPLLILPGTHKGPIFDHHHNGRFAGVDRLACRARAVEELAWRVEQAARHNIVFGTEAHIGSIVPTPDDVLALLDDVPGLTLSLDCSHFTSEGFPDEQIEPLTKHASHFHVRGATNGRVQASFSNNTIDYRRMVAALKEAGSTGWLCLEYVWMDWEHCNEVDNLSETILFRDFFRGLE